MKRIVIGGVIVFAVGLFAPRIATAQGTTTYLSNLGQASAGSLAVGSDSWLAAEFITGTNAGGYSLNSIQLAMTDASGIPSGFTVMLYTSQAHTSLPGNRLDTLDGSLNPVSSGIYTYNPTNNITLSGYYLIVVTAGTSVTNGAYDWSLAGTNSYNASGNWFAGTVTGGEDIFTSQNGSSWNFSEANPQFAINATAVPEPGVLGLLGLGGLCFLWHHRKAKAD